MTLFALGPALGGSAASATAADLTHTADSTYTADLSVTSDTAHGRIGDVVFETYDIDDLGPSNTRTGDVTIDYSAPGGTVFDFDPGRLPYCRVITAGTHFWCYGGQLRAGRGGFRNSLGLKIVSTVTAPGRIRVSCACDPNTANNATILHVMVDGAPAPPSSDPSQPSPHQSSVTKSPRPHDSPTVRHYIPAPVSPAPVALPDASSSDSAAPSAAPTASGSAVMVKSADAPHAGAGLPIYLGAIVVALLIAGAIPFAYRRVMSARRP